MLDSVPEDTSARCLSRYMGFNRISSMLLRTVDSVAVARSEIPVEVGTNKEFVKLMSTAKVSASPLTPFEV